MIPAASPTDRPHFHDALAKVGLRFTIPPNRYGTQTIGVDINVNPECRRPVTYNGAVFGENNNFTQFSGRAEPFKNYFTSATRAA